MSREKFNYKIYKEDTVQGRYVTHAHLDNYLERSTEIFASLVLGHSVNQLPIKEINLGNGSTRVLLWSQMHGNESTTTKALLDLINFLQSEENEAVLIRTHCSLKIIPILNPDGALAYTRENANKIDLNRDAQDRSQPESLILRKAFEDFEPHFCFNLHDQRTLYNVGLEPKPATLSFLAPAHDKEGSVSDSRTKSMQLIAAIRAELELQLPGQIGRYDDSFNPQCVGDSFQMLGCPTLLLEAGHYPMDYQREETRYYMFLALLQALQTLATHKIEEYNVEAYFDIPENGKLFYDILITNAEVLNPNWPPQTQIGISYEEILADGTIHFTPKIESDSIEGIKYGHISYNCLVNSDLKSIKETLDPYKLFN